MEMLVKGWFKFAFGCCLATGLMLALSSTVNADPPDAPDWYGDEDGDGEVDDGVTPWEDLTVQQQKNAYTDRVSELGEAIAVADAQYAVWRGEFDTRADDLEAIIANIGGAGAPGAVPRPPGNSNDDQAMADWVAAMQAWINTYDTWYNNLNQTQQQQLDGAYGSLRSAESMVLAYYLVLEDLRGAVVDAEEELGVHCTHHYG